MPPTTDPATIRASVAIYRQSTDENTSPGLLSLAVANLCDMCSAAADALDAAEQREAEALAQLATARAALHAGRARAEADTLSPPALDGAGEASER